jgi:hypothetical protein
VDDSPTTIEFHGAGTPRFGAGCAACGASGPSTAIRFAGAKGHFALGEYLVGHAVFAGAAAYLATVSHEIRAIVAIGVGVVYFGVMALVELRRSRAVSFDVPLCSRCALDVRSIRRATREMVATLLICLALAIGVDRAFAPAPWVQDFLHGCGVIAALAALRRIWQATKEADRLEVERRVGSVRFKFADAEAAQRFESANDGAASRVGRR